jgi:predicted HTH domain antitoxin
LAERGHWLRIEPILWLVWLPGGEGVYDHLSLLKASWYGRIYPPLSPSEEIMTTLTLELPDEIFAVMRDDADHIKQEMRLASAMVWYGEGRISQEMAANIVGMDRTDFLLTLARNGRDSFTVDFDDLDRELKRA